jgi:hypothetical protein
LLLRVRWKTRGRMADVGYAIWWSRLVSITLTIFG